VGVVIGARIADKEEKRLSVRHTFRVAKTMTWKFLRNEKITGHSLWGDAMKHTPRLSNNLYDQKRF
jgi:hypothetical protein